MLRNPVRSLAGVLLSTLLTLLVLSFGIVPAQAAPERAGAQAATDLETDLTLKVAGCEGCRVTLLSNDGANPIYSSYPALVTSGSVTFTLPSPLTAGMSVRIEPTWLASSAVADTQVVWRYAGKSIGDPVTFKELRSKKRASGCWAGTVNEAVTLSVKVRKVWYDGYQGAVAWAPLTESYVPPMAKVRRGVLLSDDVLACNTYR